MNWILISTLFWMLPGLNLGPQLALAEQDPKANPSTDDRRYGNDDRRYRDLPREDSPPPPRETAPPPPPSQDPILQYERGPIRLKIQTGIAFVDPDWHNTIDNGIFDSIVESKVWETRLGASYDIENFVIDVSFQVGAVIDADLESNNSQTSPSGFLKFRQKDVYGYTLQGRLDFYRGIFPRFFIKVIGVDFYNQTYYADSTSNSTFSTDPRTEVAGLDAWYRYNWLKLKFGLHYIDFGEDEMGGFFFGIDIIPAAWLFGDGAQKSSESRLEPARMDVFSKDGFGVEGQLGFKFRINNYEVFTVGMEWQYVKLTDGYMKRYTPSGRVRARNTAELGTVLLFIRYETYF